MMTVANRMVAASLSLVVASLALGAAQAQTPANVRFLLDWAFQGQQAAFTVPVDDGTFKRLGLEVTVWRIRVQRPPIRFRQNCQATQSAAKPPRTPSYAHA